MKSGKLGKVYGKGEVIVQQGETDDCMYEILEGKVEVLQEREGKEVRLAVLEKGEFFGEMAIFEKEVRSATVRAAGEARVLKIDKKALLTRIREDPLLAVNLLTSLIAAVTLAALDGVPPDVRQQARGLGASQWQAILLHLREARASLVAAVAAGFGVVISEVGAVMIVGGNLLGETRVMTTAIVLETRRGNFGVAIALGAVLLAIAFLINLGLTVFHSRGLRRPVLA